MYLGTLRPPSLLAPLPDAFLVLCLVLLFLVLRGQALARAAASDSAGQGRMGWGRWVAVTSCAALMGWLPSAVAVHGPTKPAPARCRARNAKRPARVWNTGASLGTHGGKVHEHPESV
jgi:hypothetical protein